MKAIKSSKRAAGMFESLGIKLDTSAPGKIIVLGRSAPRPLKPLPQSVAECLNAAKKGSLLSLLADAIRTSLRVPSRVARVAVRKNKVATEHRLTREALPEIANRVKTLNRLLGKSTFKLTAYSTPTKPVRFFLSPQPSKDDAGTVFRIINASEAGALDGLRECDWCHDFFVARRGVDRFCPKRSCRKNWHRNTPEGKKKNAEYQSTYRKKWFG